MQFVVNHKLVCQLQQKYLDESWESSPKNSTFTQKTFPRMFQYSENSHKNRAVSVNVHFKVLLLRLKKHEITEGKLTRLA